MEIMRKIIVLVVTIFITLALFRTDAFAATPSFTLYPSKGVVTVGKTFTVDVLIDSGDQNITQATATLLFDPKMVKVVKPEYNASLFCSYPSNKQSVDNKYGVVMLTGFCQSGAGTLYKTAGGADVFARVQFQVLKAGTIKLEWNHNGKNQDFMSVIMKDGSPPTNVLTTKPATATYTTTGSGSGQTPTVPNTALNPGTASIYAGLALILFGWLYLVLGKKSKSKMRTVVLYE
mgnify:CR=1 FL=1